MENGRIRDDIARCKTLAMIQLDRYIQNTVDLYRELGVSQDQWPMLVKHIWDEICGVACEHMENERCRVRTLSTKVEETGRHVLTLASELQVDVPEPDESMGLLQLENYLNSHYDKLCTDRDTRLAHVQPLKDEEELLCCQLDLAPLLMERQVPRDSDVARLTQHVTSLRAERDRRVDQLKQCDTERVEYIRLLELDDPAAAAAQASLVQIDGDFAGKCSLSSDRVKQVQAQVQRLQAEVDENNSTAQQLCQQLMALWRRLDECVPADVLQETVDRSLVRQCDLCRPSMLARLRAAITAGQALKKQHIAKFIDGLRQELDIMRRKCFLDEDNETFSVDECLNDDETILAQYEEQLAKINAFYERCRPVFAELASYQTLWQRFLTLEDESHDPGKFVNRGGNLLAAEKERRTLERRLAKLSKDLVARSHSLCGELGEPVLVHGVSVEEFLDEQLQERQRKIQLERLTRATKRKNQLCMETIFGSRPATPSLKRRAESRAALGSSKLQRLDRSRAHAASPTPGTPSARAKAPLTRLGRTAPAQTGAHALQLSSMLNMTGYSEFKQEATKRATSSTRTSATQIAANRLRRRSRRLLAGLPAASPTLRTPRAMLRLQTMAAPHVSEPATALGPSTAAE